MQQKSNHVTNSNGNDNNVKETRTLWHEVFEWFDCIVITMICILFLFTFIFRQVQIDGSSMEDTLTDGERVIVSDLFYTPKYGDIVIISSEVYDNKPIIKRVIATENQWVDIRDGSVFVGDTVDTMVKVGNEFANSDFTEETIGEGLYGTQKYPLQVPKNCIFVLGDNRHVSLDSRTTAVGVVDKRQILGKAIYRVYPLQKFGDLY